MSCLPEFCGEGLFYSFGTNKLLETSDCSSHSIFVQRLLTSASRSSTSSSRADSSDRLEFSVISCVRNLASPMSTSCLTIFALGGTDKQGHGQQGGEQVWGLFVIPSAEANYRGFGKTLNGFRDRDAFHSLIYTCKIGQLLSLISSTQTSLTATLKTYPNYTYQSDTNGVGVNTLPACVITRVQRSALTLAGELTDA